MQSSLITRYKAIDPQNPEASSQQQILHEQIKVCSCFSFCITPTKQLFSENTACYCVYVFDFLVMIVMKPDDAGCV